MAATTSRISPHGASRHLRLYECLFGRDSLVTARTLLPWYPTLAVTTILSLAKMQGLCVVPRREEEPGRIAHEIRCEGDPIARKLSSSHGWDWPYYGSVDATCLWLSLVTSLVRAKHLRLEETVVRRNKQAVSLAKCVVDAIVWLLNRLESTPLGLLESLPKFQGSLENQVWKDSWDAYSHRDGSFAQVGTVASVEAQGLTYDALRDSEWLYRKLGLGEFVQAPHLERLVEQAKQIRRTVFKRFWCEEGDGVGYFALASDRDNHGSFRQLAVRSSNMGHLLQSQLLDGNDEEVACKRASLVRALFAPDMICAAGLRTLSARETRYRSTHYHNGASWPWDTYTVAEGLQRHGYDSLASDLCARIWRTYEEYRGFPEFARGNSGTVPEFNDRVVRVGDKFGRQYQIEQPPQQVQAWTVATIVAIERTGRSFGARPKSASSFERALLAEVAESGP
ncbi:MAG: hypothetical protein LC775_12040 [Acidobacteria bacterium]|nr:hypothetical protein [Acidobacteriota bacterium]